MATNRTLVQVNAWIDAQVAALAKNPLHPAVHSHPVDAALTGRVDTLEGKNSKMAVILAQPAVVPLPGGLVFPPDGAFRTIAVPAAPPLPAVNAPIDEATLGTKKMRLSATTNEIQQYARYVTMNSDQTKILLNFSFPGRMYGWDGSVVTDLGSFSTLACAVICNTDPNKLYGVAGGAGSVNLYTQNLTTAGITVKHAFPAGYTVWIGGTSSSFEGGISNDDRFICVTLTDVGHGGGDRLQVYDTVLDSVVGDMALPASLDNAQISCLGNFVVVVAGGETRVYPRALTGGGRQLWPSGNHGDNALNAAGEEIFVTCNAILAGPVVGGVRSDRLSDGFVTQLLPANTSLQDGHVAGHHRLRPGWIGLSPYNALDGRQGDDQILMLKTDGSQTVEVYAFSQSRGASYASEPHATWSPDGRFVVYASDNGGANANAWIAWR